MVDRSSGLNFLTSSYPHALAMTLMSSLVAEKKFASCLAEESMISRLRRCSFCVATPTGQLLVWQALIPKQPIACKAEFATATASAPSIMALAKSSAIRSPGTLFVEMFPCPRQGGDCGNVNVIPQYCRGSSCATTSAI